MIYSGANYKIVLQPSRSFSKSAFLPFPHFVTFVICAYPFPLLSLSASLFKPYQMTTISAYLKPISHYPEELDKAVLSIVERKCYEKDLLFKPGRVCPYIWYLQSGLIAIREDRGDKEVYHWLQDAPAIVIAPDSSLDGIKATRMFIEPIEPCITHRALIEDVHRVIQEHPAFMRHYVIINGNYRRLQNEREADLRTLEAEERFFKLHKANPGLFQRTPDEILMKYIKISHNKFYQCKSRLAA